MPDYSKSIIYTIRSRDNIYVGSTLNIRTRKNQHKHCIYNENRKEYNYKLYKTIRENNNEWDMQPYSKYSCKDKLELTIEEERVRQLLKADMNSQSCGTGLTEKEYKKQYNEEHKDEVKQYYEEHKDKISERRKQYYKKNKDKIDEYKKQYHKQHKDKISERRKQYNDQHRDEINDKSKQYYDQHRDEINEKKRQKITCACGCVVVKFTLPRHHKTKKHINLMEKLNQ